MRTSLKDKLPVLVAFTLLLLSAATYGPGAFVGERASDELPVVPTLAEEPRKRLETERKLEARAVWNSPMPQSRGPDWIYDVFTPPEIHFQPGSNEFTIKPPAGLTVAELEEPFGVELLSIVPEAFRLRLIGHVGEGGNLQGAFEDVPTGKVMLAAASGIVAPHDAEIVRMEVRRVPLESEVDPVAFRWLGMASVRDLSTGKLVTLLEGIPGTAGTAVARLAVTGEPAGRLVRAGERFQIGDAGYTIEEIGLHPGSLTITKETPKSARLGRRVLLGPVVGEILPEVRP